jgi:hypothetical protein
MKLIQLPLHLSPEQALSVIEVLDQLQEALWNHYGEGIQTTLRPITGANTPDAPDGARPEFEDPIPF